MKSVRSVRLILVVAVAQVACSGNQLGPVPQTPHNALDSIVAAAAQHYGVPAIAMAMIWPDSIRTSVLGIRKVGSSAAVGSGDRFHLGSNTKALTATMIGGLVDRGTLQWSSTVASVFPELADSIDAGYRGITLRQLLRHRAGVPPYDTREQFLSLSSLKGSAVAQRRELVSRILRAPPASAVGQFRYSNAGYAIAASMAERATGRSWEDLMRELVFEPLSIDGRFGYPSLVESAQPWGHNGSKDHLRAWSPTSEFAIPPSMAPAGDVNMTVAEYARFVQAHLRGILGVPSVVTTATFDTLHAPAASYSMGWGYTVLDGAPTEYHNGSGGIFYATVALQKDRHFAVVVLTNAVTEAPDAMTAALVLSALRLTGGN